MPLSSLEATSSKPILAVLAAFDVIVGIVIITQWLQSNGTLPSHLTVALPPFNEVFLVGYLCVLFFSALTIAVPQFYFIRRYTEGYFWFSREPYWVHCTPLPAKKGDLLTLRKRRALTQSITLLEQSNEPLTEKMALSELVPILVAATDIGNQWRKQTFEQMERLVSVIFDRLNGEYQSWYVGMLALIVYHRYLDTDALVESKCGLSLWQMWRSSSLDKKNDVNLMIDILSILLDLRRYDMNYLILFWHSVLHSIGQNRVTAFNIVFQDALLWEPSVLRKLPVFMNTLLHDMKSCELNHDIIGTARIAEVRKIALNAKLQH